MDETGQQARGNMVLLRHTLPDGSWHFDWLIERAGEPGGSGGAAALPALAAFRVADRIDSPCVREFNAQPLPDHRRVYLTFEGLLPPGPQGEDRGEVRRVASGWAELLSPPAADSSGLTIRGAFGTEAPTLWRGRKIAASVWRFEAHG